MTIILVTATPSNRITFSKNGLSCIFKEYIGGELGLFYTMHVNPPPSLMIKTHLTVHEELAGGAAACAHSSLSEAF